MPPKPPPRPDWHPPLDPADVAMWEDVKKTVKRLPKAVVQKENPALVKARREKSEPAPLTFEKKVAEKKPPPKIAMPAVLTGFDRTSLRRIKSGRVKIDDSLDLHGLNQNAAHRALTGFISSAQRRGCKLVLVITGKGDRFSKSEGVLRSQLPRWLKETELSGAILSFSKASVAHGGEGAFYVQLRKISRS
jgi:DNA-nicking Smr family endonuclease